MDAVGPRSQFGGVTRGLGSVAQGTPRMEEVFRLGKEFLAPRGVSRVSEACLLSK